MRSTRENAKALIAAQLTRLAAHFFRPYLIPGMVKSLLQDFVDDLGAYPGEWIAEACGVYRRDAKNRSFPTPGQLLQIIRTEHPQGQPAYRAQLEAPMRTTGLTSIPDVLRKYGEDRAADYYEKHGKFLPKSLGPTAKEALRSLR